MRISDWSSDVCSSDLSLWEQSLLAKNDDATLLLVRVACIASKLCSHGLSHSLKNANHVSLKTEPAMKRYAKFADDIAELIRSGVLGPEIGRASCRERVCHTCRSRWCQEH